MNSLFNDTLRFYTEWIANKRAYFDNVGVSICIFNKEEVLFQGGFGYANIEKRINATPETIYRVASISKLFTATAIMQLVENGKLDLQEKVSKLLPQAKLGSEIDFHDATVSDLLTHTSGLPRESIQSYWNTLKFPNKNEVFEGLKLQKQPIARNTIWKYSNLAFAFLGEIIAEVSGMEYEEYIEKNIFAPLNLKNSFIRNMDPHHKNFAVGYSRKLPNMTRQAIPFVETKFIAAAANLCSNVQDLTKFLQTFMGKKEVLLKSKTISDMLRCQVIGDSWLDGFGLGVNFTRHENLTLIGHNGGFHGFITHAYFLKEKDLGMVVLTNSTDSEPLVISKYGYDLLLPTINHTDVQKINHNLLEKYAGKFRNGFRDVYIQPFQGELYYFAQSDPRPFQNKVLLRKIAENQYIFETTIGGYSIGEPVYFEFNKSGEVTKLHVGSNYFYKITEWIDICELI